MGPFGYFSIQPNAYAYETKFLIWANINVVFGQNELVKLPVCVVLFFNIITFKHSTFIPPPHPHIHNGYPYSCDQMTWYISCMVNNIYVKHLSLCLTKGVAHYTVAVGFVFNYLCGSEPYV